MGRCRQQCPALSTTQLIIDVACFHAPPVGLRRTRESTTNAPPIHEPVMAIKDGADAVLPALSTRHRPARAGALPTAMLALLCASAGLALAHHHPLAPWAAPLLFGAAAAAFGRWPRAWPLVLPALLPIIGLAPWTGWITFEEWDLLVLAIAAGGYARRAIRRGPGPPPVGSQMSPIVALLLSLYAGAMLVSTSDDGAMQVWAIQT